MNRVSGSESYQAAADLPAPGRHEARLRLPRAFRRKRGACVRCQQRRPDQLEALPMAGRPR